MIPRSIIPAFRRLRLVNRNQTLVAWMNFQGSFNSLCCTVYIYVCFTRDCGEIIVFHPEIFSHSSFFLNVAIVLCLCEAGSIYLYTFISCFIHKRPTCRHVYIFPKRWKILKLNVNTLRPDLYPIMNIIRAFSRKNGFSLWSCSSVFVCICVNVCTCVCVCVTYLWFTWANIPPKDE